VGSTPIGSTNSFNIQRSSLGKTFVNVRLLSVFYYLTHFGAMIIGTTSGTLGCSSRCTCNVSPWSHRRLPFLFWLNSSLSLDTFPASQHLFIPGIHLTNSPSGVIEKDYRVLAISGNRNETLTESGTRVGAGYIAGSLKVILPTFDHEY
jgi:hypothetical protein